MTQDLTVIHPDDRALAIQELETRFAMAIKQRELLEKYIKEHLKPGKHFYTIGNGKPSLNKEGAELICLPHSLKAHYHWVSGPSNPPQDDTPYQITVRCELEAMGKFAGEGLGSSSSMITRKDGIRVQRQTDPGLRHNATIKMACKSSYIAACLNATAASEFYTQDLEDDQAGTTVRVTTVDKGQQHWCKVHNRSFFKTAKMSSYAHPIDGSKDWCHEHKEDTPAISVEQATDGRDTQTSTPPPPEGTNTSGSTEQEIVDLFPPEMSTDQPPGIVSPETPTSLVGLKNLLVKYKIGTQKAVGYLGVGALSDINDFAQAWITICNKHAT